MVGFVSFLAVGVEIFLAVGFVSFLAVSSGSIFGSWFWKYFWWSVLEVFLAVGFGSIFGGRFWKHFWRSVLEVFLAFGHFSLFHFFFTSEIGFWDYIHEKIREKKALGMKIIFHLLAFNAIQLSPFLRSFPVARALFDGLL